MPDVKTIQLCRQIEEAVSYALAGATSPTLRDLAVVAVEPVRGSSQLRVLLAADDSDRDLDEVDEALQRAAGYLRGEVARAIHRKRVPVLELVVLPPGAGLAGEG